MQKISVEEILFLHYIAIEDFGGTHGIRNESRLLSIAKAPFQNVFSKELYPTFHDKAAVYFKSIIADHPFVDGNKRSAVLVASIFLNRNGIKVTAEPIELADFAVRVATEKVDVKSISAWLKKNSVKA